VISALGLRGRARPSGSAEHTRLSRSYRELRILGEGAATIIPAATSAAGIAIVVRRNPGCRRHVGRLQIEPAPIPAGDIVGAAIRQNGAASRRRRCWVEFSCGDDGPDLRERPNHLPQPLHNLRKEVSRNCGTQEKRPSWRERSKVTQKGSCKRVSNSRVYWICMMRKVAKHRTRCNCTLDRRRARRTCSATIACSFDAASCKRAMVSPQPVRRAVGDGAHW
jgi:hypothetical protein